MQTLSSKTFMSSVRDEGSHIQFEGCISKISDHILSVDHVYASVYFVEMEASHIHHML